MLADPERALAQRRIGRGLAGPDLMNGEAAEAGDQLAALLAILDVARRRTGAVHVRRLAGGVGGERAAAFGHHAEAPEHEHFGLDVDLAVDRRDFLHGQNARQHDAFDAEGFGVDVDRVGVGRRRLDREMQAQAFPMLGRVVEEAEIGENDRVRAETVGVVDRLASRGRTRRRAERC